MKLIVGLGNPGKDYEYTRHNLGFLTIRSLIDRFKVPIKKCSFSKGMFAELNVDDEKVFLLRPTTYMNNSGVAVKQFVEKKDISINDILVTCDDFNLSFGQIKIKSKGSDGGHNGLSSIIYHLGSEDFSRVRVGIGNVPANNETADYVLEDFSRSEKKSLDVIVNDAAECCVFWVKGEINKAMEKYNRRKENGKESNSK